MRLKWQKICLVILMAAFCAEIFNMQAFAEEAAEGEPSEVFIEEVEERNEWTEDTSGYEYQEENGIAVYSGRIAYAQTVSEAAEQLRQEMISRNGLISIYYVGEYVSGMSKDILETAVSYDDGLPGAAGDYLRYNYNRVIRRTYKGTNEDGDYYRFEYEIYYLSSYEQELAVEYKIREILDALNVYSADRETQIRSIYAYVTSHVRYDNMIYDTFNVHSAYSAAVEGKAVCQGYSLLLYRLLQELGIKNRMVAGEAGGITHVWNIVEMDGLWYNLDVTWDWGKEADFDWFLKGSESFDISHGRGNEYLSEEFLTQYVMAERDYGCVEEETDSTTLFLERCYYLILDRKPDAAGMTFWKNTLETGQANVYGILSGFFESGEFMQRDNAIALIPDILNKMSEDTIIIENVPEKIRWDIFTFVYRQYCYALERHPDKTGFDEWYGWMITGKQTAEDVVCGFVFSQEIISKKLDDEAYIKMLYRVFMGREAETEGLNHWLNRMADGMSRKMVFDGFADSQEFRAFVD